MMLFSKNLILQNDFIRLKQCRHGLMLYNCNDTIIGKSLEHYGEWCEKELELLENFITMGDVVVDVGASIGTHTLFFAEQVKPSGKVIAFEPQRLSFQMLCANVALNALKIVECHQQAIGKAKGEVIVPVIPPETQINYGSISLLNQKNGERVPCTSLDGLNLPRCELLKIDVEGYESLVLEGASQTIQRLQPIIFVENNQEETSGEIIRLLLNQGYRCWWHFCPYFNEQNFFGNKKNHFSDHLEANMLCFPDGHSAMKEFDFHGLVPVEGPADSCWKAELRRRNSEVRIRNRGSL